MIPGKKISLANDRFGNPNSSIFLNSGYCTVKPDIYFNGGSFTISGWIKPLDLSTSSYYVLIDFSNGQATDNVYLSYGGSSAYGELEIYNSVTGNYKYTDSSIELNLNVWNHLAAVLSGTSTKIYVNGTLAGTKSNSEVPTNIYRSSCSIGRSSWYPSELDAVAYFDDIRIYNVSLSSTQINSIFSEFITIDLTYGLTNYWPINNDLKGKNGANLYCSCLISNISH